MSLPLVRWSALRSALASWCVLMPALAMAEPSADTLVEALETLRADGIETLYSSRLVPSDLLVSADVETSVATSPAAPTARLEALLAPHGLEARATPDGRWVIVRAVDVAVDPADAALDRVVLDADARDEILVSEALEPPLGSVSTTSRGLAGGLSGEQDAAASASWLVGAPPVVGVGFAVPGGDADDLTMTVDELELIDPFHFRHLGRLASAVPPSAVERMVLHRGVPPLEHGDRGSGVLELLTASSGVGVTGRLIGGDQQAQATAGFASADGDWSGLAAARSGWPELPREIGEIESRPAYGDVYARLSADLGSRFGLTLKGLWADDLFDWSGARDQIEHRRTSRHLGLRALGLSSGRHLLEGWVERADVDRRRESVEWDAPVPMVEANDRYNRVDDARATVRDTLRLSGSSMLGSRGMAEIDWGVESIDDRTEYDYTGFAFYRFEIGRVETETGSLRNVRLGAWGQGTWRRALGRRAEATVRAGVRWDDDAFGGAGAAPRVSLALRTGRMTWRGVWARMRDIPSTDSRRLADGDGRPPEVETVEHAALGWSRAGDRSELAVELFTRRVGDPRIAYVNLFRPLSRFPEVDVDRVPVDAARSRADGLELRGELRGDRRGRPWRVAGRYLVSRDEDRVGRRWRPRRTDRRHSAVASLALELPRRLRLGARWSVSSGRPTTALDVDAAVVDGVLDAIGPENAERLPSDHRLDVELSRPWRWRRLADETTVAVDNLYDRRPVRGFDLSALDEVAVNETGALDPLPAVLGLGRQLRWAVDLSF